MATTAGGMFFLSSFPRELIVASSSRCIDHSSWKGSPNWDLDSPEPVGAKSRYHGIYLHPGYYKCDGLRSSEAGTSTGRAVGSMVGANLASYTAELGGKVGIHRDFIMMFGVDDA